MFSPIVLPPLCNDNFQLFAGDVCDGIEDCLDSSDEASCSYGMLDMIMVLLNITNPFRRVGFLFRPPCFADVIARGLSMFYDDASKEFDYFLFRGSILHRPQRNKYQLIRLGSLRLCMRNAPHQTGRHHDFAMGSLCTPI